MQDSIRVSSALISVFDKKGLDPIVEKLHQLGIAHSIEAYHENKLVGGLYGLSLGKAFFGESMFSQVSDASKIALVTLANHLETKGVKLIDCQVDSPHLQSLGAEIIPRKNFLYELEKSYNTNGSTIEMKS